MLLIRNSIKRNSETNSLTILALQDFVRIYKDSEEIEKTKFKFDIPP